MSADSLITALYVFALAAFLGYQVISRVPPLLHTPLMSATNAISGISLPAQITTESARFLVLSRSSARLRTSSAVSYSPIACCRCSGGKISQRRNNLGPLCLALGTLLGDLSSRKLSTKY